MFLEILRSLMPSAHRQHGQYTPLPTEATETDPLQAHASADRPSSAARASSRSARSSTSSMENPSAIEMKRSLSGDATPELSGRQPVDTKFKSSGRTVVTAADRGAREARGDVLTRQTRRCLATRTTARYTTTGSP